MSGGPSAPSNLLVQRLDTALGITLAKHGTLTRGQQPAFAPHVDRSDPPGAVGRRQDQATREPAAREAGRQSAADQTRQARLGAQRGFDLAALSKLFPSSPTSLGQAARTILSVLQQYPQTQLPPQPQLRAPLWNNPPGSTPQAQSGTGTTANTAGSGSTTSTTVPQPQALSGIQGGNPSVMQLALALARTVTQSGLFYESQLARATYGQQPMARVHAQPQAHLQMPEQAARGRAAAPAQGFAPGPQTLASATTTGNASGLQPGQSTGQMLNAGAPPLPPEVTLIVRQQLDILAQQSVMFQGEAWPGTPMEWEIERRQGQERQGTEEATDDTDHWHSHLTLHLPKLGTIAADLRLQNGHWSVHLSSDPDHADTLQRQAARLRGRFQASGLTLQDLQIDAAGDTA